MVRKGNGQERKRSGKETIRNEKEEPHNYGALWKMRCCRTGQCLVR